MVSIIIPTYNESENLAAVIKQIFETTGRNRIQAEVIVVDDNSPDGTGELAYYLKKFFPKLKTLHRSEQLGRTSAVLEGLQIAEGNIIGFMEANGSHPSNILPALIMPLVSGHIDITVASRYIPGSTIHNVNALRQAGDRILSFLFRPLTTVKDPVSDYFFVRKSILSKLQLDASAPFILLDILTRANYDTVQEVPYDFVGPYKKLPPTRYVRKTNDFLRQFFISYRRHLFANK